MTRAPVLSPVSLVSPPAPAPAGQDSSATSVAPLPNDSSTIVLPSGTTVTVHAGADGEEVVLRSARGQMELQLRITDDGPVLSLRGVRLEIDAAETVAVNCRDFEVNARDGVRLSSAGDVSVASNANIRVRSAGQTFIDGDFVNLNCGDRTGYHDHLPPALAEAHQDGAPPEEAKGTVE